MRIKITQEYFMNVVEDWYDPERLSGEGTLAYQIIEFEKNKMDNNLDYFECLKRGTTTFEVIDEEKSESEPTHSDV